MEYRDGPTARILHTSSWLTSARFSPNGKLVVTTNGTGTTTIWNAATGTKIGRSIPGGSQMLFGAAYSSSGRYLLTVGENGYERIWNAASHKLVRVLRVPRNDSLETAAFSPDGKSS